MWNWSGKLPAKLSGYLAGVGVNGVVKGDGLVWVLVRAFTREGVENFSRVLVTYLMEMVCL